MGGGKAAELDIRPVVMMGEYLDFVSQMLLAFGIVFELPLFILFLSIVGIVNYLQLIRFGRWFVLVAFTVGAIITPPDTTSQIVMSVPLCMLYFVSIGSGLLVRQAPLPRRDRQGSGTTQGQEGRRSESQKKPKSAPRKRPRGRGRGQARREAVRQAEARPSCAQRRA